MAATAGHSEAGPSRPRPSNHNSNSSTSIPTQTTAHPNHPSKTLQSTSADDGDDDETRDSLSPLAAAVKSEESPSETKIKRTRNRKPSSCVQCRRKKLRCNRGNPCTNCLARNDGDPCSWQDAVPLFDARAQLDMDELKAHVERLQSMVAYLTSEREAFVSAPIDSSHTTTATTSTSPSEHPILHSHPSDSSVSQPGTSLHSPQTLEQFPTHFAPPNLSSQQQALPNSFASSVRPTLAARTDSQPAFAMDLRANDLCEALAQLSVKNFVVIEGSGAESWAPGGGRGTDLIAEATQFVDQMPQTFGLTSQLPIAYSSLSPALSNNSSDSPRTFGSTSTKSTSPGPTGSLAFHRPAPPLSEVLKYLPSRKLALSAYKYFAGYVSWYSHPVHLPTFERQWEELNKALALPATEHERLIDPFFCSTFLAVLAAGLSMMPPERARRDGFPANKDAVVDEWLDGAMAGLRVGKFLDNPSIESVRAVTILSTYFVFMATGESSGAGMNLLGLAVNVAMSLGLHRDPDRTPGRYTFFEAEERRRLFWSLFTLCILSSASLGRTWAAFSLNDIDCKLQMDIFDQENDPESAQAGVEARRSVFAETPQTSLIVKARLAVQAKKINDRAFGIHPVTYETILDLDRELLEFEQSIPSRYQIRLDANGHVVRPSKHVTVTEMRACMIYISLASEFIRIHRPWLVLSATNPTYQYSRFQAIKYSKLLLAVYRTPSCRSQKWGGLSFKACSAALVIAVEILTFPLGSEVDTMRATVTAALQQLEAHNEASTVCRKSARTIKFMLDKEAVARAMREEHTLTSKRPRTSEFQGGFPARTLRPALLSSFSLPQNWHPVEEQFVHKTEQSLHQQQPQPSVPETPDWNYDDYSPPPPLLGGGGGAQHSTASARLANNYSTPAPEPRQFAKRILHANPAPVDSLEAQLTGLPSDASFDFTVPPALARSTGPGGGGGGGSGLLQSSPPLVAPFAYDSPDGTNSGYNINGLFGTGDAWKRTEWNVRA